MYKKTDLIPRAYFNGKKRFVQWFNSDYGKPLYQVPEVALCDEVFLQQEDDYKNKLKDIEALKVGESCIVEEDTCIITRVK